MSGAPPDEKTWPRERLFRVLLMAPRARLALDYRHPLAPDTQLWAVALDSAEHARSLDRLDGATHAPELRFGRSLAGVVAATLWDDDGPVFPSARWMEERMSGTAIMNLSYELLSALAVISPLYHASDFEAWHYALRLGAGHYSNQQHTMALATCVSDQGAFPEWYYGCKRHELTDGQWMAFWAARDYWDGVTKRTGKRKRCVTKRTGKRKR